MNIKNTMRIFMLKHTKAFWVDINFKKWKSKNISDDYFKHIIYFIAEGKGWTYFIDNKKRIDNIFKEAYRRQICRPDVLLALHTQTLALYGYADFPKYMVDWDGNYRTSIPSIN